MTAVIDGNRMGAAWKLLGSCKAAVTGNGTPVLQELQRRVSWDDEIPKFAPQAATSCTHRVLSLARR